MHFVPPSSLRQLSRHISLHHAHRASSLSVAMVLPSNVINVGVLRSSVGALSELLVTCAIGVFAAKKGALSPEKVSCLSQIVYDILLPSLLVTSVAETISLNPTRQLIPIPIFAVLNIVAGLVISKPLVSKLGLRNESSGGREMRLCMATGNHGLLPLVIFSSLFKNHADPSLLSKSVAYVSFFLMAWTPIFWTYGYQQLLGPRSEGDGGTASNNVFFGPPLLACALGLLLGSVKPVANLFTSPAAPLTPLWRALKSLGSAYTPCGLLVLAGSLALGPGSEKAAEVPSVGAAKKLFGIGMMRWAIMPLLSASVIFAAESAGFHFEPLLKFFLMMQASMPSAQNTTIMLQLANRKEAANSMARTLFLVYVAGILPTSLLITYYMTSFGIG